ncbi:MAG: hypothetical protein ABJ327_16800 [Litoreibacter sp.]
MKTVSDRESDRGGETGILNADDKANVVGRVYLLGALRVVSCDGIECTPSGTFRKALFALILLGQRGSRSRAVLQNMLWPGKHSSNLRTALSVLRRELKPMGDDLFDVESQRISIDRDRLWVDVLDAPESCVADGIAQTSDLLEGIDLPGDDIDGFEDWLRIERSGWANKLAQLTCPTELRPDASRLAVLMGGAAVPKVNHLVPDFGLLPVTSSDLSPDQIQLGDRILDAVGRTVQDLCQSQIYDYRPKAQRGFPQIEGAGPDYLVGLNMVSRGGHLGLSLFVRDAGSEALIWDQSVSGDALTMKDLDSMSVAGFVDQCSDRLTRLVDESSFTEGVRAGTPHQALNLMFQLDDCSMAQAEGLLRQGIAADQGMIFESLLSYLDTIRVGQNLTDGEPDDAQIGRVLKMVERLQQEGADALSLTTAGYALDFLTGDRTRAHELLAAAIDLNPTHAFSWDHLAMFHFRTGEYDKAFNCARRALHLGGNSPLRYSYETSLCMISMMREDYKTAGFYGKRALSKAPDFASALTFTSASLAFLGSSEEAAGLIDRMKEWEPDLTCEIFADRALVRCDSTTCSKIIEGLRRAGLD